MLQQMSTDVVARSAAQTLYVSTADGWRLALHYWPARGAKRQYPILMLPGLGANRLNMHCTERYSIARTAQKRGFDVYVLELRGVGFSSPETSSLAYDWGFQEHSQFDVTAAMRAVLAHSGAKRLHGLGHSMGGMLLYAVATAGGEQLRSMVTLGSPCVHGLSVPILKRALIRLGSRVARHTALQRVPMRSVFGVAGRFSGLASRLVDGLLFNAANIESEMVGKMAREGVCDVPLRLMLEIRAQLTADEPQGAYCYEKNLEDMTVPALVFAGCVDQVAPPAALRVVVGKMRAADVRYRELGTRYGERHDYGHVDLLLGRHAPEEVYPQIIDFFQEFDGSAVTY